MFATILAAASGCSKTEDVAPGRKVFGETPRIESFDVTFEQEAIISCDLTEIFLLQLCANFQLVGVQPTAPIEVSGNVSTLHMQARVIDPDSTPEQDNILFVGASYILPGEGTQEELTLLLRDDGSDTTFPIPQKESNDFGSKNCSGDSETGDCQCIPQDFLVTTNDVTKRDGDFTRAVVFVDSGTPAVLLDCISQILHRTPVILPAGTTTSLRLDAVDRQGNLTTFPTRPSFTTGDFSDEMVRLTCTGDECGCCLYQNPGNRPACSGKPGMNGPPGSGYEQGICFLF